VQRYFLLFASVSKEVDNMIFIFYKVLTNVRLVFAEAFQNSTYTDFLTKRKE